MSANVKLSLSPNLRLARRGSTSPLECGEKKSPLLRRGSWSPNLRFLRRASDSNFLKDSQSLVRKRKVKLFSYYCVFTFVAIFARAVDNNSIIFTCGSYKPVFVCIRMLQSKDGGEIAPFNCEIVWSETVSF